jgi:hypothetical protein
MKCFNRCFSFVGWSKWLQKKSRKAEPNCVDWTAREGSGSSVDPPQAGCLKVLVPEKSFSASESAFSPLCSNCRRFSWGRGGSRARMLLRNVQLDLCFFTFFVFVVLGFEFRALCLQDRHSTTWATLPVLFTLVILEMAFAFCPRWPGP